MNFSGESANFEDLIGAYTVIGAGFHTEEQLQGQIRNLC